jgi:single-strand DNA-binding protein
MQGDKIMANFNKVILAGNITRDITLSYLPSQTAVADIGLAINRQWKGQDGQSKQEVCFVDCKAFGKPAETINKYCKKGMPLMVEGRLNYESWTAKDGAKRNKLIVIVENFQFLSSGDTGVKTAKRQEDMTNEDVLNTPVEDDEKPLL